MKKEITVSDALVSLRPGAAWVIRDDELDYYDSNPLPCPTLEEIEEAIARLRVNGKWEEIKAERDRRKSLGCKVVIGADTLWFHTDDRSCLQYSILDSKATRGGWPDEVVLHPKWKTMSGQKVPMTVGLLRQILDSGVALEGELFDAAELHKSAMIDSGDPDAYDYSTGWPETYDDYAAVHYQQ